MGGLVLETGFCTQADVQISNVPRLVEGAAENKILTCLHAYRVRLTWSVSWKGKYICFKSKRR